MGAVVADTQSIVWYFLSQPRLSRAGMDAIGGALRAGDPVCVSAITLVELVYLTERRRVPGEALARLKRAIDDDRQGVKIVPVDLRVAQALESVPREIVPDMPDRIIAATARYLRLPLVTSDSRIRRTDIETIW